jgi:hypothetical protein
MGGCGSSFIIDVFDFYEFVQSTKYFSTDFSFSVGFPSTPAVDQKFVGSFSSFWGFVFTRWCRRSSSSSRASLLCFARVRVRQTFFLGQS